jgi:hypothetical protein
VYLHGIMGLFLLSILGIIASFLFFSPLMGPARAVVLAVAALVKFVAVIVGVGAFIMSRGGSRPHKPAVTVPEG